MKRTPKTDEELLAELTAEKNEVEAHRQDNAQRLKEVLGRIAMKHGGAFTASPVGGDALTIRAAPERVIRLAPRAKKEIDPKWFSVTKVCPHCDKEKNVGKDFGIVVRRGLEHAAGWCRDCRSKTSGSYLRKAPPKKRR